MEYTRVHPQPDFQPNHLDPVEPDHENESLAPEQQHDHVKEHEHAWHGKPRKIHQRDFSSVCDWAWNVILTFLPLYFLVLGILALRHDGQPPSPSGERLIRANHLSPTLYPILFAVVATRFYRGLARWRLESDKGVGLGSLELLFGSQSFAGVIERLSLIRASTALGSVVLISWAMSPLGGQSSSRLLHFRNETTYTEGKAYYYHPGYGHSYYSEEPGNVEKAIRGIYTTSLSASVSQRRASSDLWGLVKIPQWPLHETEPSASVNKSALANGMEHYTSLIGTRIQGLNFGGSDVVGYTFNMETSYLDLDCRIKSGVPYYTQIGAFNTSGISKSLDQYGFVAGISTSNLEDGWDSTPKRPSLQFYIREAMNVSEQLSDIAFFNCSIDQIFMDVDVTCNLSPHLSCSALALRRRPVPSGKNVLDYTLSSVIPDIWPKAVDSQISYEASPTAKLLYGEEDLFVKAPLQHWGTYYREGGQNLTAFSRRLTTVFNTIWQAAFHPHDTNKLNLDGSVNETISSGEFLLISEQGIVTNATRATAKTTRVVYKASVPWTAILFATTLTLQIMAILGLLLKIAVRGPDLLGFASSMTRDNALMPSLRGGSALGGPERARLLRDVRVQLVDVQPGEVVGYVALRTVSDGREGEEEGGEPEEGGGSEKVVLATLDKHRLYW